MSSRGRVKQSVEDEQEERGKGSFSATTEVHLFCVVRG